MVSVFLVTGLGELASIVRSLPYGLLYKFGLLAISRTVKWHQGATCYDPRSAITRRYSWNFPNFFSSLTIMHHEYMLYPSYANSGDCDARTRDDLLTETALRRLLFVTPLIC